MSNTDNIHTALLNHLYGKEEIFSRFGRYDVAREDIAMYIETAKLSWPPESFSVAYNRDNMEWIIRECKKLGSFTIAWQIHEHSIVVRAEKSIDLAYLRLKHTG